MQHNFKLTAKPHSWLHVVCGGFFAFLIILPLTVKAQNNTHPWITAEDAKIIRAFTSSGEKGVLAAFKGNPKVRLSPLEMTYDIQDEHSFQASYLLANYTDEVLQYTIICLIDYQQVMLTLDSRISKIHQVTLLPRKQKILSLNISPIEQGAHDLIILAVRDGIEEKNDFSVVSHRANLFSRNIKFPSIEHTPANSIPLRSEMEIQIISNELEQKELTTTEIQDLEQTTEYFIKISNFHEQTTKYAVILFNNFHQPNLNSSNTPNVYYTSIAGRKTGVIPWKIIKNNHDKLLAIAIENPYQIMEPELGKMTRNPTRIYRSNYSNASSPSNAMGR